MKRRLQAFRPPISGTNETYSAVKHSCILTLRITVSRPLPWVSRGRLLLASPSLP